jgi:hypothetical protein
MTIFNKDGKVYILKGPNPLVKTQENWDPSGLVFHNFNWDEIKIKNSTKPKKVKTDIKEEIKHTIKSVEIKEPEPEIKEEVEQKQEKEQPISQEEKSFDLPHLKYKVLAHCLPAKIEKRSDSFYGESWERVKYGTKLIFPCIMINSTDFAIEFWTSDPDKKITESSIIYPFSYEVYNQETENYDRVPYDEYRWWKVTEKEKKEEGGWLFRAIPSDIQPDFS